MTQREESRGIGDLLGDLGRQVSTLVRKEIDLARVEVTSGVTRMGRGAAMTGAGAVLLYAGLLVLLGAIVLGLIEAGMEPWLSALVVAIVVLVVGGVVTAMGINQVKEAKLAPTEAVETVKEDVEFVKEHIK